MRKNAPKKTVMVHTSEGLLPSATFLEGLFENVIPANATSVEFTFVDDETIDLEVEYYIEVSDDFLHHTFRFYVSEYELYSNECGLFMTEDPIEHLTTLIEATVDDAAEGMLEFS